MENEYIESEKLFSPDNLKNLEQREALQRDVNEQNKRFADSNEIAARELKAISEALDVLTKAGVAAYVHPFCLIEGDKRAIKSYHNVDSFIETKNDKLSKKSFRLICHLQHSFISHWFSFIRHGPMGKMSFTWGNFCRYISETTEANRKWLLDSTEFKDVEEYKE